MSQDQRKILVIDDDAITRKVVTFALKKNNYEVFEAEGSKKAFEVLDNNNISLVFCDVMMNDMNGFDFCKSVREQEKYRALPFVFITARTNPEDRAKAFELGADDFVTKPFNADDLLMKANSILKRIEIYRVYGLKRKFDDAIDLKSAKILFVDDDPVVAKLFSIALINAGFDCRTENNALDGLETARTYLPDIILSDFMMPEIDGFEFRKLVLQDPLLKDIPFVFLTANDSDSVILEGYNLDIKDYILKTTNPKVVAVKVSNVLKNLKRERQVALKELQEAADSISMEVVPSDNPQFNGYSVKHWHSSFKGIPGGDFIDYINIGENKMAVILGDIMGKKWGAWFFAFSFIGYIRSAVRVAIKNYSDISAAEILNKVNEIIYSDAKISEIFSTVSVVLINNDTNVAQYAGAGDLPPIIFNTADKSVSKFKSDGLLLGLSADNSYSDFQIKLNKDDFILLYTDGIIESRNKGGEQFGHQRFEDSAKNSGDNTLDSIKKDFSAFTDNIFDDDVSLICIKKL